MISSAMLMAAGLGTRMSPFTDSFPKPFLPLFGVPTVQYALDHLFGAKVSDVVLNLHHEANLAERLSAKLEIVKGAHLHLSDERAELLGSAGGIRSALKHLKGDRFFVVNGDSLSDIDLRKLEGAHEKNRASFGALLTLALVEPSNRSETYREIKIESGTGKIRELGTRQKNRPYYSGVAILERAAVASLVDGKPADFVEHLLGPAVQQDRAGYEMFSGFWADIGSPDLWMETHFTLLDAHARGKAPSYIQKRIDQSVACLSGRRWKLKSSKAPASLDQWLEPCFWGGEGEAPHKFGPKGVSYNDAAHTEKSGIGFAGKWVGPTQP